MVFLFKESDSQDKSNHLSGVRGGERRARCEGYWGREFVVTSFCFIASVISNRRCL